MVSMQTHFSPSLGGFVKFLLLGILVLVTNLGCGGYGSGMGMTAAPAPAITLAPGGYSSTPVDVANYTLQ